MEEDNQTERNNDRNFIDKFANIFQKMSLGILKFCFIKLPGKLYELLISDWRKIFRYIYSIIRLVFWITVWLLLMFAAWITFALDNFIHFWAWVAGNLLFLLDGVLDFLDQYKGPIWFALALIGSIYGLLYISLKKWAEKRNRVFHGVFGFLHRRKKN